MDAQDRIRVPPEDPQYLLRRVWLTKEEENGYYYGFANEGLWPLCHITHTRPSFRFGDWKIVLLEQRAKTMQVCAEPFVELRIPKIFNLRRDPFERADENSNGYWNWVLEHFYIVPAAAVFLQHQLQSFKQFPPRQEAPSFDVDKMIERMNKASDGSMH